MKKDFLEEAYMRWIGQSKTPVEQETAAADGNDTGESSEPYVDIEPTVAIVKLPFDVSEGDLIDVNAIVKKINEDGSVEIEINKAFKK